MIKKIDEAMNWVLLGLFTISGIMGFIKLPLLLVAFGIAFVVAIVVSMIKDQKEKKDSKVVNFKFKIKKGE